MSGTIAAGAMAISAVSSAYSANKAASAQKHATSAAIKSDQAIADQQLQFAKQQWADQQAMQAPWLKHGKNALREIEKGVYDLPDSFSYQPNQLYQDPGYAFRLQEGMKALDRQAAARGGLISGNALRAAQRYGQDMGSQEYQNAYNRALTEYNASAQRSSEMYNRLAARAGIGQTATSQLSAAGQDYASQGINTLGALGSSMNQNITGAGNAKASSYIGQGNALSNAISQGAGLYQNYQMMNMLNKGGTNTVPFWQQQQYGYSPLGPQG